MFLWTRISYAETSAEDLKTFIPQAKKLYERITGVKISKNSPVVRTMALKLSVSDKSGAAEIAVNDSAFINVRSRNFAISLSNKSNSINMDLDETSMLILGIIRDNNDFRDILKAPYTYTLSNMNAYNDKFLLTTTNPFTDADNRLLDLNSGLKRVESISAIKEYNRGKINKINADKNLTLEEKSRLINENAIQFEDFPEPAGILTSRGFASTQYSGGSNRRPVEFIVKNFLCSSMAEIGNNTASDAYVGKDIDRFVGGSYSNYVNNCKSCHTVMDGMRGAFAKVDFSTMLAAYNGNGALVHGMLSETNKTNRELWYRDIYNNGLEISDITRIKYDAVFVKNFVTGSALDFSYAVAEVHSDFLPSLAERREQEVFQFQTSLIAPMLIDDWFQEFKKANPTLAFATIETAINAGSLNGNYTPGTPLAQFKSYVEGKTPTTWPVWKKNAYKTVLFSFKSYSALALSRAKDLHWALKGMTVLDPLVELVSYPSLKSLILKNSALPYSESNTVQAWIDIKNQISYFNLMGNYIFSDARSEIIKYSKTTLDQIYANKEKPEIIAKYSSNCLINTNRDNFLNCELEFNKEQSILGSYLIKKIKINSNNNEFNLAISELIKQKHVGILNSSYNSRIVSWISYLVSIDKYIYFSGYNFDLQTKVSNKMNGGSYTNGFTIKDDSFVNLASESYGWRGPYKQRGKGLIEFGTMISDSEAFSSCMTKKIYQNICYQDLSQKPEELKKMAQRFEQLNYKIKDFVKEFSINSSCGVFPERTPASNQENSRENLHEKN